LLERGVKGGGGGGGDVGAGKSDVEAAWREMAAKLCTKYDSEPSDSAASTEAEEEGSDDDESDGSALSDAQELRRTTCRMAEAVEKRPSKVSKET
jgi:hypothetical protein